jgi:hypothetical protein
MGNHTTIPIAALAALTATGCGHAADPVPPEPTPAVAASASVGALPEPAIGASPTPPFRAANGEVAAVAVAFVRVVVEYDTPRENRLAFLPRLRGLATPAELDRVARSPRTRLPWRVLRARAERTHLLVNGVSLQPYTGDGLRVVVEATLTTHTMFATVTGFRRFTLILVPTGSSWLVDRAEGLDP